MKLAEGKTDLDAIPALHNPQPHTKPAPKKAAAAD
jgi:hypothetical protein